MSTNCVLISDKLAIRNDSGIPVVNSRDVADRFGKRHSDVLRDIDNLLKSLPDAKLRSAFNNEEYADANGIKRPSFNITRQGFTLLVMGWTGERAMKFKVAYIEAFDAMEAELSNEKPSEFILAIREIVAPLAVRFSNQDTAIERVETKLDNLANKVDVLERNSSKRREITKSTRIGHLDAINQLGGHCPCCGTSKIIDEMGQKLPFVEFDHFFANSQPNLEHTWPICRPCHTELTTGRIPRDQRDAEFKAYQAKRRRLPRQQITFF